MAKKGLNIYKRKDGRWEGRIFLSDTDKKYRSVYGKSYAEAKEKLLLLYKSRPVTMKKCKLTVKGLFELWLDSLKFKVKRSTYAAYVQKLDNHILPELGDLKFEDLTVQTINEFIHRKLTCGRLKGGALSEKYVRDIVVLLKSLGKFARKNHGCNDVMQDVSCPKIVSGELHLISKAEEKKLLNALFRDTDNTELGIMLSYYTGIRLGELCALKWADIDFAEKMININKTIQRVKNFDRAAGENLTELIITTPKSKKSNREIPIPSFLLPVINKLKSDDYSYILSNTENPIEPRLMQYRFKKVLKKANLPSINFHSLRHFFATNSLQAGFDIKTLSEILGHSSIEITLNRYVHSSRERKRECMSLLQAVV